jgi:hypothetical protein
MGPRHDTCSKFLLQILFLGDFGESCKRSGFSSTPAGLPAGEGVQWLRLLMVCIRPTSRRTVSPAGKPAGVMARVEVPGSLADELIHLPASRQGSPWGASLCCLFRQLAGIHPHGIRRAGQLHLGRRKIRRPFPVQAHFGKLPANQRQVPDILRSGVITRCDDKAR